MPFFREEINTKKKSVVMRTTFKATTLTAKEVFEVVRKPRKFQITRNIPKPFHEILYMGFEWLIRDEFWGVGKSDERANANGIKLKKETVNPTLAAIIKTTKALPTRKRYIIAN